MIANAPPPSNTSSTPTLSVQGVLGTSLLPVCGNGVCEAGERPDLTTGAGCGQDCPYPVATCGAVGGAVCNGAGACIATPSGGQCACRTSQGYTGTLCGSAAPKPSMSTESILLIIVCVVLAGVLGVVAFMVIKLRRLNVNPSAYNELQGKYNELGMMS